MTLKRILSLNTPPRLTDLDSEELAQFEMIADTLENEPVEEDQLQELITHLQEDADANLRMEISKRLLLRKAQALPRILKKRTEH